MRISLFLLLTSFSYFLFSQSIDVNPTAAPESNLTAEELTFQVLIDGGDCAEIDNFQLTDNFDDEPYPSPDRSWGYFERGSSDFPFESGIVLTSGFARRTEGPDNGIQSDGETDWDGDDDADELANTSTFNATIFEFDFVPFGNEISFNYIFASEEYPGYTCSQYNDVFGFIISGPGIVNDPGLSGKNIALLPNDDFVTINNVNRTDIIPNPIYGTCGSSEYFVDGPFPYIEHGGRTVPLTAYSEVQPGETYHIRLLVADAYDYSYDSAVFLEAGSFNLGGTLVDPSGATIGESQILCDIEEYPMTVNLDVPSATYQWKLNGIDIPGETSNTYTATESGIYSVLIFAGDCESEPFVDLTFSTTPTLLVSPLEKFICTEDGVHEFNLSDYDIEIADLINDFTYYASFTGADTEEELPIPDLIEVETTDGIVTVYVRVENPDGCYSIAEIKLEVGQEPETTPFEYPECDEDGDGFAVFDLNAEVENLIVSDPAGLNYEFFTDAAMTELIADPANFTNTIVNTQIIYVRIFNPTLGAKDCPTSEEMTLIVEEFPLIQADEWSLCDNLNDNSEFVDLTQNEIVQTEGLVVTYAYSEQDGTMITDPENYEMTTSPTIINVMVTNETETCQASETITLTFDLAPELVTANLERCSSDNFAEFFLPEANELVIEDTTDLIFTYYLTEAEAILGDDANALPENFTNTIPDQSVFVRVVNLNGCFNVVEVILDVNNGPATAPLNYPICDDNGDGIAEFNLETEAPNLLTGALGTIEINYFLDEAMTTPIPNPATFENTSNPQIVYISFFDPTLGAEACTTVEELTLVVEEFPALQPNVWTVCDNENDGSEIIDLTTNNIVLTEGLVVSYEYSEQDGTAIADPMNYEVTASPAIINVLVRNQAETCEATETITIQFLEAPTAVDDILPLVYCSLNEYAEYNLTDLNEFLVTTGTAGLTFSYHLTLGDARNDVGALPENYTNTSPDQIIFVRIENANGCFDIGQILLETELVHNQLTDSLMVCDDPYEISDGIATFDLTVRHEDVENSLGGDNYTVRYYLSLTDALSDLNMIPDPTQFQNTTSPQTIFAVASDGMNGCAGVVDFPIEVLSVPEFELPEYLAFCNYDEKSYEFLPSFTSYTWLDAEGNVISNQNTVDFDQEGMYTLEVTGTENDCPARRDIEIIFDNQPTILDVEVDGETVTISATGGLPPYQYSINNGLTWSDHYIMHNVPGGIYDLIVKSKYGCISTAKTFGVLGVPNLITPNGDGKNDYWEIRGLEAYPDAHIKIFDRYGKIFVDRTLTVDFRWDGKYKGEPIPSGDYWYIITIEEGTRSVTGHVSVRNRFLKDNY
ncbi:choice-of-anchor L domain-containing protein [Moheibacter lacus]|uniref:Choice-of-anchor L domain-containing protein n=1 Tax=Moheibacter lacus TaxID=2745851 RepID=A0A838ZS98_9FLAO|nr:choice-of-anchor L domain-containing protein [Moheibacter lacus]MBA5629893.1 choice-of-anchor L domain-containing protein [Moheibacter lacus]